MRLYSATPPTILPAAGKVHIALLAHLLDYAGMGGTKWILQFDVGSQLTGCLHHPRAAPTDTKRLLSIWAPTNSSLPAQVALK